MDDPNRERLVPISPPEGVKPAPPQFTPYQRWCGFIRVFAGLAAVLAMLGSAWFFSGFVENDQGFWHLLSAFGLSFATGALAYVPLGLIAFWVHQARRDGPSTRRVVLSVLLLLPWAVVAALLMPNGGLSVILGITILVICLILLFWCALSYHQIQLKKQEVSGQ